MPKRRDDGSGNITKLPSGRFRAQKRVDGKLRSLGTFETYQGAEDALKARLRHHEHEDLITLGVGFLEHRKLHVRDFTNDEARWRLYIEGDPIGEMRPDDIRRADVIRWIDRLRRRGLRTSSVKNAYNILRQCFIYAMDREMVTENPTNEIRITKPKTEPESQWAYLDYDEQVALLQATPDKYWPMVAFALGTGMRQGEQYALLTKDVHIGKHSVTVRHGSPNGPTKGNKVRKTPLMSFSLDAAKRALLATKRPLLFPSRSKRQKGLKDIPEAWHYCRWPGEPSWFQDALADAGIKKHFRWHDLRHTCATSLLAGWWGRKWSLDEVCQMLGHSSTKVTERYAHLVDTTLERAASETHALHEKLHALNGEDETSMNDGATFQIRTGDLRFTKTLEVAQSTDNFAGFALAEFHESCTEADNAAFSKLLEATRLSYRKGDPIAKARVRDLIQEIVSLKGWAK